jgi:MFS transporter, ACS family, glucarate transporter
MLFGLSCASYVERMNISVAAELMMPALSLSKGDMALIFNSFLIGYAIFQVPAGWLGDRFGSRLVLGASSFLWGLLTLLSGLLPGTALRTAFGTIALLWLLRFLLGTTEASTYPVAAQAVHRWMTPSRRGTGNSLMLMGSSVASALTAPFVSWSMLRYGWRASFYLTSIAAFAISLLWLSFTRTSPAKDDRTTAPVSSQQTGSSLNINVVLLALSYMSEGYLLFMFVSWLYIYLVEVRGFSLARGGVVASLPWIAAIVATPLGGVLSDRLSVRFGRVHSARILIMTGYMLSGTLLLTAAEAHSRLSAVLALCQPWLALSGGVFLLDHGNRYRGKQRRCDCRFHEYGRHPRRYRFECVGAYIAKTLWPSGMDPGLRFRHRNGVLLRDTLVDSRRAPQPREHYLS